MCWIDSRIGVILSQFHYLFICNMQRHGMPLDRCDGVTLTSNPCLLYLPPLEAFPWPRGDPSGVVSRNIPTPRGVPFIDAIESPWRLSSLYLPPLKAFPWPHNYAFGAVSKSVTKSIRRGISVPSSTDPECLCRFQQHAFFNGHWRSK